MTHSDSICEHLALIDWSDIRILRAFRTALDQTRRAEYQHNIVNYDSEFTDLIRYYKITFMLQFMIGTLDILIYFSQHHG